MSNSCNQHQVTDHLQKHILFLDDNETRCEIFRQREPDAVIVTTAEEAITALQESKTNPFTEVHLDHDLNGETFVDSDRKDCGMEVVRWICFNKPDVREFIVHTHHIAAGALMCRALIEADYVTYQIPFAWIN